MHLIWTTYSRKCNQLLVFTPFVFHYIIIQIIVKDFSSILHVSCSIWQKKKKKKKRRGNKTIVTLAQYKYSYSRLR